MTSFVNACPDCSRRVAQGEIQLSGGTLRPDQLQAADARRGRPCQLCRVADGDFVPPIGRLCTRIRFSEPPGRRLTRLTLEFRDAEDLWWYKGVASWWGGESEPEIGRSLECCHRAAGPTSSGAPIIRRLATDDDIRFVLSTWKGDHRPPGQWLHAGDRSVRLLLDADEVSRLERLAREVEEGSMERTDEDLDLLRDRALGPLAVGVDRVAIRSPDGVVYDVPPPGRHPDVIHKMRLAGVVGRVGQDWQGFLLTDGRFVGREEAGTIALVGGQLEGLAHPPDLFSEDLW